jgi:hypothetical protein
MHSGNASALAPALRAVGRLLDMNEATNTWIDQAEHTVSVAWRAGPGTVKEARYSWADLERLDAALRTNRGRTTSDPGRSAPVAEGWSQLLRTVGQDLDRAAAESSHIAGDMTGLSTRWTGRGGPGTREYTAVELWTANSRRASARRPAA